MAYALNELRGDARQKFEAHRAECNECAAAAQDLGARFAALRRSAAALEHGLRPDTAGRVAAGIRRQRRWDRGAWLAAAAVLSLAIAASFSLGGRDGAPAPIARAVDWLQRTQESDGSWDPARWEGESGNRVGVSGLILLVLARTDPERARETIRRGSLFLVEAQDRSGLIGPPSRDLLCNQSICTLALLEVHARNPDPGVKSAIDRALDRLLTLQLPSGGWGGAEELELWTLETLLRARELGWKSVSGSLARASGHAARRLDGGEAVSARLGLDGGSGRASDHLYSALAVLLLDDDAAPRSGARRQALDVVTRSLARAEPSSAYRSYLLSRAGGSMESAAAQSRLGDERRALESRQISGGPLAGSWDPDHERGQAGGRLATTALAALSLHLGPRL